MNIIQRNSTHNTSAKSKRKIEFIVLHYTAGTSSSRGKAIATANGFATSSREASADFIVDDFEIVQYNGNIENRYTWAVGGSKLSSKTSLGAKFYKICTNANSISIEMCSNKKNTTSLSVNDDDWYLTEATINNAIELTKYLMKKYNIDIDHVIMHHMVTGKPCPQPWCKNETALVNWRSFLNKIAAQDTPASEASIVNYQVKIKVNELNVRSGPGNSYAITTVVPKNSVYTIVAEQNGWGKLKSGAGWIYINNPNYVTIINQSTPAITSNEYKIQVTASSLNIRKGPGVTYATIGSIRDKGIYTIINEQNGWGELKSGGWISLKYTIRL
jgi:N-acetyl-anhydromuramyl-L-alanine amidase AmpD